MTTVESLISQHTRVIHVFDREGDITEVLIKLVNISTPEFLFVRLITGA